MVGETNFFSQPIINSPYEYPDRHWELDPAGQPTNRCVNGRRRAEFITPVPKPQNSPFNQTGLELGDPTGVSTETQKYDSIPIINELRAQVDRWRALKNPRDWNVTPETARLLQHWHHHRYSSVRPFFCEDLKNTGKGNLFVIFGEPDIEVISAHDKRIAVKINGVDVFHPNSGEVRSHDSDGIACWFIDTDYNSESFFVRHAYFLGASNPFKALKITLNAEIDEDAWSSLNSDISYPFNRPASGRIAVR